MTGFPLRPKGTTTTEGWLNSRQRREYSGGDCQVEGNYAACSSFLSSTRVLHHHSQPNYSFLSHLKLVGRAGIEPAAR